MQPDNASGAVLIGTVGGAGIAAQRLQVDGGATGVVFQITGSNSFNPGLTTTYAGNTHAYTFDSQNFSTSTAGDTRVTGSKVQFQSGGYLQSYQQSMTINHSYASIGVATLILDQDNGGGSNPTASTYKILQGKFLGTERFYIYGNGDAYFNPTAYTTAVGGLTIARSGNFTGVAAETAIDINIKPASLTFTEPASGTFTWNAGQFDLSNIAVTAGAGTSVFNSLRLAGVSDADAGTVRGLFVDNLTGTAATEEGIHVGTGWDYAAVFEAGNVGIGDTTPDYGLDVVADINSDDCFREAGTQVAGTCASDERLKQNIVPLDGSLEKILALNPVSFEWKEGIDQNEGIKYVAGRQVGLIAQEVQNIFPHLVKEKNGFLAVEYNLEMQMEVINAIKDMDIKITGIGDLAVENSWRDSFVAWFSNASNRITRIFTGEICLTDPDGTSECINKAELHQLKQLLNNSTLPPDPIPASPDASQGGPTPTPTPTPDPEPIPEVPPTDSSPEPSPELIN